SKNAAYGCKFRGEGLRLSAGLSVSGPGHFSFSAGFILHDISCDSACGYSQRTCQVHLSRAAPAREVAVLGADHYLFRPRGNTWSCVDTGSATGLDYMRASFLENIPIPLANAVIARLLRSALSVEEH